MIEEMVISHLFRIGREPAATPPDPVPALPVGEQSPLPASGAGDPACVGASLPRIQTSFAQTSWTDFRV